MEISQKQSQKRTQVEGEFGGLEAEFAYRGYYVVAFASWARHARVSAASAAFGSVRLGFLRWDDRRSEGKGAHQMLNLPKEANFLEWVRLWIGLRDKRLKDQVGQIVTWLRFAGIGFVLGSNPFPPQEV